MKIYKRMLQKDVIPGQPVGPFIGGGVSQRASGPEPGTAENTNQPTRNKQSKRFGKNYFSDFSKNFWTGSVLM